MPWSWISAPLMCSDSLPCSCCVYIPLGFVNAKEGWGLSTVYQHVVGGVSACSHQSPLWHELPSYWRICLSTWPNAIGREIPVAAPPRPPPPAHKHSPIPPPLLSSLPFAFVNYVSAGEAAAAAMRHTVVASHQPGSCAAHVRLLSRLACRVASATPNAFLTGFSGAAWLDTVKTRG